MAGLGSQAGRLEEGAIVSVTDVFTTDLVLLHAPSVYDFRA